MEREVARRGGQGPGQRGNPMEAAAGGRTEEVPWRPGRRAQDGGGGRGDEGRTESVLHSETLAVISPVPSSRGVTPRAAGSGRFQWEKLQFPGDSVQRTCGPGSHLEAKQRGQGYQVTLDPGHHGGFSTWALRFPGRGPNAYLILQSRKERSSGFGVP